MASYDLRCDSCGQDFELFVQGFLKDEHKVCPDCGSREVAQRYTGFLCGTTPGGTTAAAAPSCGHAGFG